MKIDKEKLGHRVDKTFLYKIFSNVSLKFLDKRTQTTKGYKSGLNENYFTVWFLMSNPPTHPQRQTHLTFSYVLNSVGNDLHPITYLINLFTTHLFPTMKDRGLASLHHPHYFLYPCFTTFSSLLVTFITFFPVLLRFHWDMTLYRFKVYSVICYMYIFQNDHHKKVS